MAYSFDGSNDGLSVSTAPTTSTTMSMAGWFWINTGATTCVFASLGTSGSGNNRRDIIYDTTGTLFRARSINNAGTIASATISPTGFFDQWVFLAGVWNGVADRTIYRGTSSGNNTTSNSPNSPNEFRVGISHTGSSILDGRAAEVGLWDAALTAADIAMLAKGLSPLSVRSSSLVGYWDLVRDLTDRVGGNTLSLVDAPTVTAHPRIYLPRSRAAMVRTAVSATPKRYLLVR